MATVDRRTRRQVTRAVRLGKQLPTAEMAQLALEQIPHERRGARRSRTSVMLVCLVPIAVLLLSIIDGEMVMTVLSAVCLASILSWFVFYFPRFERNLAQAEELNRAVVDRAPR